MKNRIKKSAESEELLSLLSNVPPDLAAAEVALKQKKYSADAISRAGYDFVFLCDEECNREEYEKHIYDDAVLDTSKISAYMPQVIGLLLKYGLDPNADYEYGDSIDDISDSIMYRLKYIDNEYVAADTLALFFEYGGKPEKVLNDDHDIDFDVIFDVFEQPDRRVFDSLVHCWFVLLAYTDNIIINKKEAVSLYPEQRCECNLEDFKISDLKNHRNYYFGISNVSGRGEDWSLHIFDKRTRWEVARL